MASGLIVSKMVLVNKSGQQALGSLLLCGSLNKLVG